MKINTKILLKVINNAPEALQRIKTIPWERCIVFVKNIKPRTWITLGSGLGLGVAGGVLLRQPEINKLSEAVKKSQSEQERLQLLVQEYHEVFVAIKANKDIIQADEYVEQAKRANEDARSIIMYQYAAKEYIEIGLKPRGDNGILVLPEKEYEYYLTFQKVQNGEKLEQDDAKKIQNYIYPRYKKQIENLVEYDFEELMTRLREYTTEKTI